MEWLIAALVVYWVYRLGVRAQVRREERGAEPETSSALVIPGVLMAVVDDYAYWIRDGVLVRAPYGDHGADVAVAEPADPLECDDLPPALVVEVLDALEQAERQLRGA